MILLTGITGRIGGAAADTFKSNGIPFRALARDPQKAERFQHESVELIVGDLEDSATVDAALAGVSRALIVTPNNEKQLTIEKQFADAASRAGVQHIVKISSMEASATAVAPIPKLHFESEQHIKSLDLSWTMVQPNFFMQNLLLYSASIKNAGSFALPLGNAKTAPIDARDVGAAVATILQADNTTNSTYRLTGTERLTFTDVAAQMSAVLGKEIRYIDQSPEDFRAFMSQFIASPWHVEAICALFAEIADGALDALSPSAGVILGREPTTLRRFTEDFSKAFA